MRAGLFWLDDRQWECISPRLPTHLTGPEHDDDRRIISGIIHMLQCGARWRDCPPEYGPYTTIYNRFNRWSKRGRWGAIFDALANCGKHSVTLSIDSTSIKAHRSKVAEDRPEVIERPDPTVGIDQQIAQLLVVPAHASGDLGQRWLAAVFGAG